jgi:hypothetical protein
MNEIIPRCYNCKNYTKTAECPGFPDEIPADIKFNRFLHTAPYPGDHGYRYSPIDLDEQLISVDDI